jgi:hypothetical protein
MSGKLRLGRLLEPILRQPEIELRPREAERLGSPNSRSEARAERRLRRQAHLGDFVQKQHAAGGQLDPTGLGLLALVNAPRS